ncbi:hexameric tyrosine-coordinated heme protein [Jejuia spongiicola]|uniref:Hexameric tyrosine-coordinated heme protein n=1 Tax=Jejuia spongiicola TaxID=2942207 RepID=A0ABT0QEV4_9FLAO|nr:hexameric tyrosine-coordinated heme protein [Jejuia spongiicola]MCL6295527.1 hexameric tyrosine-coordinated heme protein [Jejuia spongiicola]
MEQKELWLTSLIVDNPQEGFELAIKLSRMGVKSTQPDIEVLKKLRKDYSNSASGLTAASHVIAVNFQTISAANEYWKK